MILDYFRPTSIQEAIELKANYPEGCFIGGGTTTPELEENVFIIDLQKLPLRYIRRESTIVTIGATTTLEELINYFIDYPAIVKSLQIEASRNIRNVATIGGLVSTANSRSTFLNCLNSMVTHLKLEPTGEKISIDEYINERRLKRELIVAIEITLPEVLLFESVSRSPLDVPIVSVAAAKYTDKTRVSCGGFGEKPILISYDTKNRNDVQKDIEQLNLQDDEWGTAEFRKSILTTLIKRMV